MDRVGALIGRSYRLFRYTGHPEAERVVVVIGSAFEVLDETAAWLNAHGEKVGVLHVTLYRPWDAERFVRRCRRRSSASRCSIERRNLAGLVNRCISTS